MIILYSQKFLKSYKKLPEEIKKLFEEKENVFRENPFDSKLKTHKLHGKFSGYYSFSVNYKYRLIFNFAENQKDVRFHVIGQHNIYE